METRANYILVGAFTLAGFVGSLFFFVWFAQVQFDQQYDYYDVRFTNVSGLSAASDVRFAGVPVGQVVDISLSQERDGAVVVRLEVEAGTPVREDSLATIEALGVTGVSFVAISAGSSDAPLLEAAADEEIPRIEAGRSALQSLTEDAPEILDEVLTAMRRVNEALDQDTIDQVDRILANVERSSESFAQALEDFEAVTTGVGAAGEGIAEFAENLDDITEVATQTMRSADTALLNISGLARRAEGTLEAGETAMGTADDTMQRLTNVVEGDLRQLIGTLDATSTTLREDFAGLSRDARLMIREYTATGAAATRRLSEARETLVATDEMIEQANRTLITVDRTAADFDTLMQNEGAALIGETRTAIADTNTAIAAITTVAEEDLPAIMADIRAATEQANATVASVGADISGATGRFEGLTDDSEAALKAVTETFTNANETLAAINAALETGERTLAAAEGTFTAAEGTFTGAERVINEDIGAITSDLRQTMSRLDAALEQVSDDVPLVTADLRAAAESARETLAEIGGLVGDARGPIFDFTRTGLPQYTILARETRSLVSSLERISRQIEREPARFLLDRQSPEFRR